MKALKFDYRTVNKGLMIIQDDETRLAQIHLKFCCVIYLQLDEESVLSIQPEPIVVTQYLMFRLLR